MADTSSVPQQNTNVKSYPESKILMGLYIDVIIAVIMFAFYIFRWIQKRKDKTVVIRPSRTYLVENITITIVMLNTVGWTILSNLKRMEYIRWLKKPEGYPPPQTVVGHKVNHRPRFDLQSTNNCLVFLVCRVLVPHQPLDHQDGLPQYLFPYHAEIWRYIEMDIVCGRSPHGGHLSRQLWNLWIILLARVRQLCVPTPVLPMCKWLTNHRDRRAVPMLSVEVRPCTHDFDHL